MDEETDYVLLHKLEQSLISSKEERIVSALKTLDYFLSGYQVSRLEHSLKTVTLAKKNSENIQLIIAAVIQNISHDLASENHSRMVAAIIQPHVCGKFTRILATHGIFQMYYYADQIWQKIDERERWREHRWFASCERFCRDWVQALFGPVFVSKLFSHFIQIKNEILSRLAFVPHISSRDASGQQPKRL